MRSAIEDLQYKLKMNKLADIEKKFNEEKYFKEDQNRPFVIENSNQFLQNVSV